MVISYGEFLVDMMMEGEGFVPYPGGAPANYAVGLSRLGERPKLIASVGKDFFGDMLVRRAQGESVDTAYVKRSEEKTTLAIVKLTAGVPDFIFYRLADADISPGDIDESAFQGERWMHCGFFSLTDQRTADTLYHCLGLAHANGLDISCSPNIRPDVWDRRFDAAA